MTTTAPEPTSPEPEVNVTMPEANMGEKPHCPDGGTCHSFPPCKDKVKRPFESPCYRVAVAGPLSHTFPQDTWPTAVRQGISSPMLDKANELDRSPSDDKVADMAVRLMRIWGAVDPQGTPSQHPQSYVANFVDMARVVVGLMDAREERRTPDPSALEALLEEAIAKVHRYNLDDSLRLSAALTELHRG